MRRSWGKVIAEVKVVEGEDDELRFRFSDGSGLRIFDQGQSCCERRHMTCDDDLSYYAGSTLLHIGVADGPTLDPDTEPHEQQFLNVTTSKGVFTCVNHNEHNGYYGGFDVVAEEVAPA